jgi:glycosyltransferase involved in cell wall biosynthesis
VGDALAMRLKRALFRAARGALVRYARARPDAGRPEVFILLTTAWGMGGTIRTILNLAHHLSAGHEVTILSVGRTRERPFFPFPPGVKVVALEDRRRDAKRRPLHRLLRTRSSVLMHPDDKTSEGFSLWIDLMLVRRLRRRSGFLITTRPGLNVAAARLAPPGLVLIGQEHMHLDMHPKGLRRAMPELYPRLDALAVLTEGDRRSYAELLDGEVRTVLIPNTVRDMGAGRADLDARTAITAGRFTPQKGYDLLIPAWAQVAAEHPEWRLRICGSGQERAALEALVEQHGLGAVVSLERPARDLGAEMERASIFVLSSRHEGLPLVLLEAMSKGMAVLSYDCPTGPAELIDDHRNGILVPAGDVDAFAAGLRELMQDEELRRRCAAAAVETASAYTVEAIGRRWEALLDELAEARGRARRSP